MKKATYISPILDIHTSPVEEGFLVSGGSGSGDYGDFGDLSLEFEE